MPVNQRQIAHIAEMLTDDPNLLREYSGDGTSTAEEVPLLPHLPPDDPRQIVATVEFSYSFDTSPGLAQTFDSPAEPAGLDLADVQILHLVARDAQGRPVPSRPEFAEAARRWLLQNPEVVTDQAQERLRPEY